MRRSFAGAAPPVLPLQPRARVIGARRWRSLDLHLIVPSATLQALQTRCQVVGRGRLDDGRAGVPHQLLAVV